MGKIYNEDLHNLCWHDYVKVDVDSGHEDHSRPGYDALLIGNSLRDISEGLTCLHLQSTTTTTTTTTTTNCK